MSENFCFIWGTQAEVLPVDGDYRDTVSHRAGGAYRLTGSVQPQILQLVEKQRVLLTDWITQQHQLGNSLPTISTVNLKNILQSPPKPFSERFSNFLRLLHHWDKKITEYTVFTRSWDVYDTLAKTSSLDENEIQYFCESAFHRGFLEFKRPNTEGIGNIRKGVRLTANGYNHLEMLDRIQADSTRCFVAMWFSDEMNEPYSNGIHPAVSECGYEPIRIDNVEHIDKIDDRIIAEIRKSRFLVADFTSESEKPRGGVYYEAGFAQGLGLPVIWTCRADLISQIHFDTRQYNHIVWENSGDLKKKLKNRILAVIGEGPVNF